MAAGIRDGRTGRTGRAMRVAGLAAFLATIVTFSPSLNVFAADLSAIGDERIFPLFAYVSLTCACATSLVLMFIPRSRPRIRIMLLALLSGAFVTGGVGYVCLATGLLHGSAAVITVACLAGSGSSATCVLWCRTFRCADIASALVDTALACILYGAYEALALVFGIRFSAPVFLTAIAATVVVPMCDKVLAETRPAPELGRMGLVDALKGVRAIIALPMAGLIVFAFVMGFRQGIVQSSSRGVLIAGFLCASLLALGVAATAAHRPPMDYYYRQALPSCAAVAVAGSYAALVLDAAVPSALFLYAMFGLIGIFSLASTEVFGNNGEFDATQLSSVVYGLFCLFSCAGLVLTEEVPGASDHQDAVYLVVTVAFFALLVVFALHFASAGGTAECPQYAQASTQPNNSPAREADTTSATHVPRDATAIKDDRLTLEQRCSELAVSYNLSPRETQILTYMARGYSAAYIGNALLISPSTARTHVTNIHRKLGVESRDGLLMLVHGEGSSLRFS